MRMDLFGVTRTERILGILGQLAVFLVIAALILDLPVAVHVVGVVATFGLLVPWNVLVLLRRRRERDAEPSP